MSSEFRKNWHRIELVASLKNKDLRNALLKEFSKNHDFNKALRELAKNTLRKKIPLTPNEIKRLSRHKRIIKGLAEAHLTKTKKRELVCQSGGYLPIIIPLVAQLLGELIRNGAR